MSVSKSYSLSCSDQTQVVFLSRFVLKATNPFWDVTSCNFMPCSGVKTFFLLYLMVMAFTPCMMISVHLATMDNTTSSWVALS